MFQNYQNLLDKEKLQEEPRELREICEIIFSKGKNLRSRLISLVSFYLQLKDKDTQTLCRIIEYIHNSSLLHDDFIDHSGFRRNQKTAWLQFSPEQAVLAGDYLLAQVNIYLSQEGNLPLLELTAESIKSLAKGEFLQRELYFFCKKDLKKINQVSEYKTGSLFKWCLKAPFVFKKREDSGLYDLLDLIGYHLGLLYQRFDDLLDFDKESNDGKPILSDLKQSYYNSFSCYLVKDIEPTLEQKYQNCKTISEIHEIFPNWEETLKTFHKDNQELIQDTEQKIEKLKPFLNQEEQLLIKDLKTIPSLLYWRKG